MDEPIIVKEGQNTKLTGACSGETRTFKHANIHLFKTEILAFQKWRDEKVSISIDVGCGVGLHPVIWSKANPQSQMIAIERTTEKAQKLLRRLDKNNVQNVMGFHADANYLLPKIIKPDSVEEIFILYPNPYPKGKHKNLRFGYSLFTPYLAQLLKSKGKMTFATNLKTYCKELVEQIPAKTDLKLNYAMPIDGTRPPRSHFEKKYLLRGQHCFEIQFVK